MPPAPARISRSIRNTLRLIEQLEDSQARSFVSLVDELRRDVVLVILNNPGLGPLDGETIKQAIDQIMLTYRTRFMDQLSENQRRLFIKGIQLVDSALKSADLTPALPYLSEQKLLALQGYGAELVTGLTDRVRNQLRQEIDLAVLGQKPVYDVIQAIGKNLKDPSIFGTTAKRAEVIVRTEVNRIQQVATSDRMRQAAAQVPGLKKKWIHSYVGVPRRNHLIMHGVIVKATEKFELFGRNGKVYMIDGPHDPELPAGETVNCRCKAIPVVPALAKPQLAA